MPISTNDTFHLLLAAIAACAPLLTAWLADRLWGDPPALPHLIVGFGKAIATGEHRLNKGSLRLLKGSLLALFLVLGTYCLTAAALHLASVLSPLAGFLLQVLLIFYCLAGTTLRREVRAVFAACERSVDEGRRQVGRIVGRDTSSLSGQEVRTAALETLAENLSDGVVAPLFWYALLGVPGMVAYKMVNTLDSMIGYRNERYRLFGRFAARLDDVANFLPARLTALLMLFAARRVGLWSFVRRYGRQHLSPNSGYPEAALAGILDCRFGGPHNYFGQEVWKPFIGSYERPLDTDDLTRSVVIARRTEAAMLILCCLWTLPWLWF